MWKANVRYAYTTQVGKQYKYRFEAWTQSGERTVRVHYCSNIDDTVYVPVAKTLTTDHQTFEVIGQPIPIHSIKGVEFQCADQTGTFYVKMLSIEARTE
jgi:hypothetical protein